MIQKIDHIGIAVTNLDEAVETYKKLGLELLGMETVEDQMVRTAFFRIGESCFELLEATDPNSAIARYIDKNGGRGGIQHIAMQVDDVDAEIERLKGEGFLMIDESARDGAHGNRIAFLHPKSSHGTLLEVCAKAS